MAAFVVFAGDLNLRIPLKTDLFPLGLCEMGIFKSPTDLLAGDHFHTIFFLGRPDRFHDKDRIQQGAVVENFANSLSFTILLRKKGITTTIRFTNRH